MVYNISSGKASTPHLKRYWLANKSIKLIPTNLFVNNTNETDNFGTQHIDDEGHYNSHNKLIDVKSGVSFNIDLKMTDINELEQL